MEVYIVRHGHARDPHGPHYADDRLRPLTDDGHAEVATIARVLRRLDVTPDLYLSSPLVRARETAEDLAALLDGSGDVTLFDELAPAGSPAAIVRELALRRPRQVVLTGHMPDVGRLAGYLTWQDADIVFPFRTAEVCRIDLPDDDVLPGRGDLRWLIPPKVARKLVGEG